MKLLHIAGLTLLLVLAGCATPQAPEKAATAPEAASAPSAPAVIPSGPLQPITAAEASWQREDRARSSAPLMARVVRCVHRARWYLQS